MTVTNSGTSSLTVTKASASAAGVTVSGIALPLTIAAGGQSTFDVIFTPKTAGALSGSVSVMTDASTAPNTVSLSGTGMAATALLTTTSSSLNFGTITIGKSDALSVTLTNAGNRKHYGVQSDGRRNRLFRSGVSAGLILAPGQSATLDGTFTPGTTGSLAGSVTIASNASNSPMTISLAGAGTTTASHSVAINWTPSSSAVAGYNVYRSQVSGGPYSKLDSTVVSANSYVDATVQAGQTYYYVVTSVTSGGTQSADSTQALATVPTP